MRKDVKFGLTVGAILVVTLIVYALVLSRSGQAVKTDEESAINQPATPTDSAAPAPTDQQPTAAPANPDSTPTADNTNTPSTQPTAGADQKFDWNTALTNGGKVPAVAPERTETPTTIARVSPDVHPALIDSIPSTQPQPTLPPSLAAPEAAPIDAPALAPVTPPAAPASTTPRTHVIAEGESLWTISAAIYGNGKYYTRIIAANPNLDPKDLKVGTTLNIPALSGVQADSASAATPAPRIDQTSQYQVVSGDTLEKIARKLYSDPTMADKLYDANRTVIGPDEDRLKVGMVLKLPTPPTEQR